MPKANSVNECKIYISITNLKDNTYNKEWTLTVSEEPEQAWSVVLHNPGFPSYSSLNHKTEYQAKIGQQSCPSQKRDSSMTTVIVAIYR